jgi:two-component system sensor histidine kinase CiaH
VTGGQSGDARLLGRVRWQLVAWSGGVVLVVLLALGIALYAAVARSLEASARAQLDGRAEPLVRLVSGQRPEPLERSPVGITFGGPSSGTFAFVVPPSGAVIGPAGLELPSGLPDATAIAVARTTAAADLRTVDVGGTSFRVLSLPVDRAGTQYVIQVVQDITAERRTLGTLVVVLAVGGFVAVLAAIGAGAINARRALVPIRDALRRQREFAADASHELRTPLTVVRASVDDLRRNESKPVREVGSALDDITAEVDHLTGLVDDLLLLARSDSGVVELAREPIDLGDVAAEATGGLAAFAAGANVHLALDPAPSEIVGDSARLRQLVAILVDNAIRHGPAGGTVTVTVRVEGGDGHGSREKEAVLTVDDEGPGVAVEHRAQVFDRFWRAPGAPPGGTGLGLAIAAWIVERHRGTIAIADRPGGGSRFTVRLPAGSSR